jgi:hypothetical protein
MYDLIQSALTATIEAVAIAGLTGIIIHAFYTRHTNWMNTYCPPIENYTPDTRDAEALTSEPEQPEETTVTPAEISFLAKGLVTQAIPATDAALEALKEVEKPAARKPHSPKPRSTRKRKAA